MIELVSNNGEEPIKDNFTENIYLSHTAMPDKPGYEDIGHGILVKRNFLDLVDLNFIKYQAEELPEEDWFTHPTGSYFQGKISTNLRVEQIASIFIDEIMPEYWTNEHKSVNRVRPGDELIKFGWGAWNSADYLVVYYFGEWEGGEVTFLEKDGEEINFTFMPEQNNLYLFPIQDRQFYISSPVTSGIKYSHIDWVYKHGDWVLA